VIPQHVMCGHVVFFGYSRVCHWWLNVQVGPVDGVQFASHEMHGLSNL